MNNGLYALAGASATATAAACEKRLLDPMTNVSKVYLGFSRASSTVDRRPSAPPRGPPSAPPPGWGSCHGAGGGSGPWPGAALRSASRRGSASSSAGEDVECGPCVGPGTVGCP